MIPDIGMFDPGREVWPLIDPETGREVDAFSTRFDAEQAVIGWGEPNPGDWHLCRSWNPPDPFAPDCGCALLPCGHVSSDAAGDCAQHGIAACKSMRSGHRARFCKGAAA